MMFDDAEVRRHECQACGGGQGVKNCTAEGAAFDRVGAGSKFVDEGECTL